MPRVLHYHNSTATQLTFRWLEKKRKGLRKKELRLRKKKLRLEIERSMSKVDKKKKTLEVHIFSLLVRL